MHKHVAKLPSKPAPRCCCCCCCMHDGRCHRHSLLVLHFKNKVLFIFLSLSLCLPSLLSQHRHNNCCDSWAQAATWQETAVLGACVNTTTMPAKSPLKRRQNLEQRIIIWLLILAILLALRSWTQNDQDEAHFFPPRRLRQNLTSLWSMEKQTQSTWLASICSRAAFAHPCMVDIVVMHHTIGEEQKRKKSRLDA